jgi:hypothetical protein
MAEVKLPHPGHEKHLCYLNNLGLQKSDADEYKELIKDAKFYCENCGRAAGNEKNLCRPVKL